MKRMLLSLACLSAVLIACESEQPKETPKVAAKPVEQVAPAPAPAPAAQTEIRTIDWAKAIEMAKNGAVFLDVRYPEELAKGYVPNAMNIPLDQLKRRINELPKDKDLLIYCRSGRRSETASSYLQRMGYDRVYNVAGGFLAYPQK